MSSTDEPQMTAAEPAPSELLETVTAPAKVMRIGSMVKQLLEECGRAHSTRPVESASRRSTSVRSSN